MHFYLQIIVFVLVALPGCGKYGPPVPPEALTPQSVQQLEFSAQMEGVTFTWRSPEQDRRGEELMSLDGYTIYRAAIDDFDSYIEDPFEASQELAFIPDSHIMVREDLRKEARLKGLATRKVKVSSDLKSFRYVDTDLTPGLEYVYMIVPMNQDGEEGEVSQYIRVLFRGDSSEVRMIDQSTLVGEL